MEENTNKVELVLDYNDFAASIKGFILPEIVYESAITKLYNGFIESGAAGIPLFIIHNNKYELLGYADIDVDRAEIVLEIEDEDTISLFDDIDNYDVKLHASNVEFSYLASKEVNIINNLYIDMIILKTIHDTTNEEPVEEDDEIETVELEVSDEGEPVEESEDNEILDFEAPQFLRKIKERFTDPNNDITDRLEKEAYNASILEVHPYERYLTKAEIEALDIAIDALSLNDSEVESNEEVEE